jgi:hypothetical protein
MYYYMIQEETLIQSHDFKMLPNLIQYNIPLLFGPNITHREMYLYRNSEKLHTEILRQIGSELSVNGLEALSFSQWLKRASIYSDASREQLAEAWPDASYFSFDPKLNPPIADDCIVLSDSLIKQVNSDMKQTLLVATRVHFTRGGDGVVDNGGSQNMAFFGIGDKNQPTFFLVDCAAYFYNPAWAKAWRSSSIKDLFTFGTEWLSNGEGNGHWDNPIEYYKDILPII